MRTLISLSTLGAVLLLSAVSARAVPTAVVGVDMAECDTLVVPSLVDELGEVPPFPVGEQIAAAVIGNVSMSVCSDFPDGAEPNPILTITNLNTIAFSDVWYVADNGTLIQNMDGRVNGRDAFKIDDVGINRPLLGESGILDGIFAPGETWTFIIQDYDNPFQPADALSSIGVPSNEPFPPTLSSGSIIAVPVVPEPASAVLLGIGLLGLAGWHRRRN